MLCLVTYVYAYTLTKHILSTLKMCNVTRDDVDLI